jgi:hypothetical protein
MNVSPTEDTEETDPIILDARAPPVLRATRVPPLLLIVLTQLSVDGFNVIIPVYSTTLKGFTF